MAPVTANLKGKTRRPKSSPDPVWALYQYMRTHCTGKFTVNELYNALAQSGEPILDHFPTPSELEDGIQQVQERVQGLVTIAETAPATDYQTPADRYEQQQYSLNERLSRTSGTHMRLATAFVGGRRVPTLRIFRVQRRANAAPSKGVEHLALQY